MHPLPARSLATSCCLACLLGAPPAAANEAGDLYVNWGYNRSAFAGSDIHFTGDGHDFTLERAQAHDRPETDVRKYVPVLGMFFQPQYNLRVGYHLSPRVSVSFGMDHMKYVVTRGQRLRVDGTIGSDASATYAGTYNRERIEVPGEFLKYEHSDGLNYFSFDVDVHSQGFEPFNAAVVMRGVAGVGVGPVVPRSDVRLFGEGKNNDFHVAGYGASGQLGWVTTFFDLLYLRTDVKAGWMNLPSILTTGKGSDRASQQIAFLETYVFVGTWVRLGG